MITNPLLEEIWAVKDRLAVEAGNDIHVFCEQLRAWESSHLPKGRVLRTPEEIPADRKSTRLNSSHRCNSYAVFCFKKGGAGPYLRPSVPARSSQLAFAISSS